MIIIKSWTTGFIIYKSDDAKTVLQAVVEAVKCGADLYGADLSGAYLSGVPVIANIHQAVYRAVLVPDALDMSRWHTCETTHCRGGWVINLAGAGGAALECEMGTSAAAAFIYMASDPCLEKIPDFHCDNETALIDMQRLAADAKAELGGTG